MDNIFSIQDRAGFYENIMRISTQNNEEPKIILSIRNDEEPKFEMPSLAKMIREKSALR
jgi:translation initiation factor 1 (eIF-1/SUI1)